MFSIDLKTLLSILSEIPKNMAISIDRECINSIVSLVFVYAVFFMKKDALLIYVLFERIDTTFAISRHFN